MGQFFFTLSISSNIRPAVVAPLAPAGGKLEVLGTPKPGECQAWAPAQAGCARTKLVCPQVFLIGTNHGGSTTLAAALKAHPHLHPGKTKEHRFLFRATARQVVLRAQNNNTPTPTRTEAKCQPESYKRQFEVPCNIQYTFDASPQYTFGPAVKTIYTIRDPVVWLSSMRHSGRKYDQALWDIQVITLNLACTRVISLYIRTLCCTR